MQVKKLKNNLALAWPYIPQLILPLDRETL